MHEEQKVHGGDLAKEKGQVNQVKHQQKMPAQPLFLSWSNQTHLLGYQILVKTLCTERATIHCITFIFYTYLVPSACRSFTASKHVETKDHQEYLLCGFVTLAPL